VNSSHNSIVQTVVNFASVKFESGSNANDLSRVCVLGNTIIPGESFVFKASDDNTCAHCASGQPSSYNVKAESDSDNNAFTNLRLNGGSYSQDVSGDSSVSTTFSVAALECLN